LRNENLGRNSYNSENGYSIINKNAISDGDEKGKGQLNDMGTIGSKTDILKRVENTGKNEYNSKKEYNRSPRV
jgi:hypothetical protein